MDFFFKSKGAVKIFNFPLSFCTFNKEFLQFFLLMFSFRKLKENFYTEKTSIWLSGWPRVISILPRSELKTTLLRLVHRLDFVSLNDKVIVCVQ